MAVLGIYSGDWPDYPSEREALLHISRALDGLEDWFILFVRMQIPEDGRPDLVIFKSSGIFIVELKHCEAPVYGRVNGPWYLKEHAGSIIRQLNEGQDRNPYQQVDWHWRSFKAFIASNPHCFLPSDKARLKNDLRSTIVICPEIPKGSDIETDYKVPCLGLDSLPEFLWREGKQKFVYEPKEIEHLAEILGLRYWRDIKTLISANPREPNINWNSYISRIRSEVAESASYFVPQKVVYKDGKICDIVETMNSEHRLFIIGPAGIGKSTQLGHFQDMIAQQYHQNQETPLPLPIVLGLYDKDKGGLQELVRLSFSARGLDITQDATAQLLKLRAFTFLMDGVTEILREQRVLALREMRRWIMEYPQHHYILTGRSEEGIDLPEFMTVSLQPLSDEDLQSFLDKRLKNNSPDLYTLSPQLREIMRVPFFAEAFVELCSQGMTITDISAAGLIAKFVEALLEHDIKKMGTGSLGGLRLLLAEIAASMQRKTAVFLRRDEFIDSISNAWRCLYEADKVDFPETLALKIAFENPLILSSKYAIRFLHQLIQEYFAGRWLIRLSAENSSEINRYLADPWWSQPVVFAASSKGEQFISHLVQSNNLWAIGQCLNGDAGEEVQVNCRREVDFLLSGKEEEREKAVRILSTAPADPYTIRKLLKVITEEESRSGKESVKAIGIKENKVQFIASQPFFGSGCFFKVSSNLSKGAADVLIDIEKLSPSARRCALFALQTLLMGRCRVLLEDPAYLAKILNSLETCLKADPDSRVHWAAVVVLSDIARMSETKASPRVIELLHWVLEHEDVLTSQEALQALESIGELVLSPEWISSEVNRYLDEAEHALAGGDVGFVASLAANCYDEILGRVMWEVIERLGNDKYERLLLLALPTLDVREKDDVICHLGKFGSDRAVEHLERELYFSPSPGEPTGSFTSWSSRWNAVNALVRIGTPEARAAIDRCIEQVNKRWDVALLGAMGHIILHLNQYGSYEASRLPRLNKTMKDCWDRVGGRQVLECLDGFNGLGHPSGLKDELFMKRSDLTISKGIVELLLDLLPKEALRSTARQLLEEDNRFEFICRVFSRVGKREDLPLLRSKLHNPALHDIAQNTIQSINERLQHRELLE